MCNWILGRYIELLQSSHAHVAQKLTQKWVFKKDLINCLKKAANIKTALCNTKTLTLVLYGLFECVGIF